MATTSMNATEWVRKRLEEGGEDLVREMLQVFVQKLLSADADAICGAPRAGSLLIVRPRRAGRRKALGVLRRHVRRARGSPAAGANNIARPPTSGSCRKWCTWYLSARQKQTYPLPTGWVGIDELPSGTNGYRCASAVVVAPHDRWVTARD